MLQRWLVAVIGLPLLLAVLLLCPAWATALLVCALAGAAAFELLRAAGKNAGTDVLVCAVLFAAGQVGAVYAYRLGRAGAQILFLGPFLLTALLFAAAVTRFGTPRAVPFSAVSAGIVGGAVFPMMFSALVLLRLHGGFGRLYVLAPFFAAFPGDSLAMYCGKWFGKRKLTPVSPKKTWAGFYGNLLGSALGLLIFGFLGGRWLGYEPDYLRLALAGAVSNLMGQLGDLATSLVKREANMKDYSHLFLTHGGVLDRFDSTLFIAPTLYFLISAGVI